MNLLREKNTANYLVTGFWGKASYDESKKYCNPNLVAPLPEKYDYIPTPDKWNID